MRWGRKHVEFKYIWTLLGWRRGSIFVCMQIDVHIFYLISFIYLISFKLSIEYVIHRDGLKIHYT